MADKLLKFEVAVMVSDLEYFRVKNPDPDDPNAKTDYASLVESSIVMNVRRVRQIEDKPKAKAAGRLTGEWTQSEVNYAKMMTGAPYRGRWAAFAGYCFLYGIQEGYSPEKITEYLFENFHGMTLQEIPKTPQDIRCDLKFYIENR